MKRLVSVLTLVPLLISIFALAFNLRPVEAEPGTIMVPDDYPTIQEAINNADDGDTIHVRSGTYYENVIVNRTVLLIGENKIATIIDGSRNTDPSIYNGITITAPQSLVTDFRIQGWYVGMRIETDKCTVVNNTLLKIHHAIDLAPGTAFSVIDQNLAVTTPSPLGWAIGIWVYGLLTQPGENIVSNNVILTDQVSLTDWKKWIGVYLEWNYGDRVTDNIIVNNGIGIHLHEVYTHTKRNIIKGNRIVDNFCGIVLSASGSTTYPNLICHNDFINKDRQTWVGLPKLNVWDDGYPSGGNYWSDYSGIDEKSGPSQDQPGSDGIGDEPYVIADYNVDNYPVMNPWYADVTPPALDLISPQNMTYFTNDVPLDFRINEEAAWMGYSLDDQNMETIFSNATLNDLSEGSHNIQVYAIDDSGNMGISEKVFFTITLKEIIAATMEIAPNTLNLGSTGQWITSYTELLEGFNTSDIDISSILLNETIPADPDAPMEIGDYDDDDIPDLMVKFERADVISYILANVNMTKLMQEKFMTITLTINGKLSDGSLFQGSDSIRIVYVTCKGGGRGAVRV